MYFVSGDLWFGGYFKTMQDRGDFYSKFSRKYYMFINIVRHNVGIIMIKMSRVIS